MNPFTLRVPVTTAGNFTFYYEVLLTAATEYQSTPLITMNYTVCGQEKVIVGTYNSLNAIVIKDNNTKLAETGEFT